MAHWRKCSKCGRELLRTGDLDSDSVWQNLDGSVDCFPSCEEFVPTERKHDYCGCSVPCKKQTDAPTVDNIARPRHYTKHKVECIDMIFALDLGPQFCLGNVVKYVYRWQDKGGIEDLRKARQYLDMLIERKERSRTGFPAAACITGD